MKDGHVLKPEVYTSLSAQTIPIAIMPITRIPLKSEIEEKKKKNIKSNSNYFSQGFTKNIAIKILLDSYKGKYSLWHCSDVVLTKANAVELAIEMLKNNPKLGAVYFNTEKKEIDLARIKMIHCDLSSVVCRNEIFNKIQFRTQRIEYCLCGMFKKDLSDNGWEYRYVSSDVAGYKIKFKDAGDLNGEV
jgi:hypothetical protein